MSEEAANAPKAVPYGILMYIGSCWLFGWIICIVFAACMSTDIDSLWGSAFGTPLAQIYFDAVGKKGALGLISLVFIVKYFMGLSILVAVSRQSLAFSRDGALPFSTYFKHVFKRLGYIPARAVWGCVLVALVLGLLCLIDPAATAAFFSLAVAANKVAWGVPIFCRVVWGGSKFRPGRVYKRRLSKPIGWLVSGFRDYDRNGTVRRSASNTTEYELYRRCKWRCLGWELGVLFLGWEEVVYGAEVDD